ncbi:MAG: class I SAM-dependent methyltransferase [Candidatus Anstonellales archaeon]
MSFKEDFILTKIKNKDVLDIGSGGDLFYLRSRAKISDLLAYKMKSSAKSLTLVEIDKEAVDKLKNAGFVVYAGDAEKIRIKKKFDVIVLGDVIEHVNNVGLLLENMKRHLKKDGELIISTPNPFSLNNFFRILTFRKPTVQFDHTAFIEPTNLLEICRRHHLKIKELYYYTLLDKRTFILYIKSFIIKLISVIYRYFNLYWLAVLEKE